MFSHKVLKLISYGYHLSDTVSSGCDSAIQSSEQLTDGEGGKDPIVVPDRDFLAPRRRRVQSTDICSLRVEQRETQR